MLPVLHTPIAEINFKLKKIDTYSRHRVPEKKPNISRCRFLIKKTFEREKTKVQIKSMRSVTPNSLIKLTNLFKDTDTLNSSSKCQYCTINTRPTLHSDSGEELQLRSNSGKRRRLKNPNINIARSHNKLEHIESKSPLQIQYAQFKEYHCNSFKGKKEQNQSFLNKHTKQLQSNRFKKIELEPRLPKKIVTEVEDTFLKSTMYSKPAITYGEKVFRLNQISIF